jgi:hypothetical protein
MHAARRQQLEEEGPGLEPYRTMVHERLLAVLDELLES